MSNPYGKEEKEPTLFGVLFMGLITAFIGAVAGFVFLSANKAEVFSTVEERDLTHEQRAGAAPMPSDAYFMEGARTGSAGWEIQRGRILTGSDAQIDLSMGELNAWMASRFRSSGAAKQDNEASLMIIPGTPNFFAEESGVLSVNLPTEVIILGKTYKYVVTGRGRFLDDGSQFTFDHIQVNAAAIPGMTFVVDQMLNLLLPAFSATEEFIAIQEAWDAVDSVQVTSGLIRISRS